LSDPSKPASIAPFIFANFSDCRASSGKGGVVKRISQRLNPRVCRVAALPTPNERERTQSYFRRYVAHLPAAGEIVLFDRSWYNRAGVARVMGFCTEAECEEFLRMVPEFERMLVRSGSILIKYWFSSSDDEQHFRFMMRIHDPLKQWKLSPIKVAAALGGLHTEQRRSCWSARTLPQRHGGLSRPWTRRKRASTAFAIC
jgi:polyphosphate kinase 2 (PPK2 family)